MDLPVYGKEYIAKHIGHGIDQGIPGESSGEVQPQECQNSSRHAAAGAGDLPKIQKNAADAGFAHQIKGERKIDSHCRKQQKPPDVAVPKALFHGNRNSSPGDVFAEIL